MKLDFKYLAPYLPFELKILYFGRAIKMNAGLGSSTNWIGITAVIQRQGKDCMPILRPLSELTKEIEHNGEKFVPKETLSVWNLEGISLIDMNYIQVNLYQILLEWHFDVSGLIPEGLAVDINSIEQ